MTEAPAPARRDAAAMGLRYVIPGEPGLERRRSGKGFAYRDADGSLVTDEEVLGRIQSLAIPPAWTEVWICADANGHIQATGRDARGRRQYRYHPRFRSRRDRTKFARLVRFGERLPRIRRQVARDLRRPGLPREKVLAAVVALLETTRFRVGNAEYARVNRSFGLSTLRDRHARIAGTTLRLRFRGKGGRTEEANVVDRRLATVVRRCQDLPGQELFQYVDDEGEPRPISSEDVNAYVRAAAGSDDFSAKDFRTWTATVLAHRALREALAGGESAATAATGGLPKRIVADAIQRVADALGDTVAVTKSAYVHPAVLEAPPEAPARARVGRRASEEAPTRADELAVLSVLRSTAASPAAPARKRPARRSQAARRGQPRRSSGRGA